MSSFCCKSTFSAKFGFNTTNRENSISGSNTSIIGRPCFIQPAKSKLSALAAIALGGEPTSVPRPPMLAQ